MGLLGLVAHMQKVDHDVDHDADRDADHDVDRGVDCDVDHISSRYTPACTFAHKYPHTPQPQTSKRPVQTPLVCRL